MNLTELITQLQKVVSQDPTKGNVPVFVMDDSGDLVEVDDVIVEDDPNGAVYLE